MLWPDLARRALIPELMDDPAVDTHALFPALKFLALVNGLPGGAGLIAGKLLEQRDRWRPGEPLTLVDVGTGAADVPRLMVGALAAVGHPARALGIDLHPRTIAFASAACAAEPAVALVRGDALALPLKDRSVDYAVSSTFLHHLDDEQAKRCLTEMHRVARRGLVVTDLVRSRSAYLGVRLTTMFAANRLAAHDGPVSVRRAFTGDELLALAETAGIPAPRVTAHVPFRQALVASW